MRRAPGLSVSLGVAFALWAMSLGSAPAQETPAGVASAPLPAAETTIRSDPSQGPRHGNPLWAIPLKSLSATRERPLFSATRRPPQVATVPAPPPPPPPPIVAEGPPPFTLIGTLVAAHDGHAILLDPATRAVVRLHVGDGHQGWILRAVDARTATLERDRRAIVLRLPARAAESGPPTSGAGHKVPEVRINLIPGPNTDPVDPME